MAAQGEASAYPYATIYAQWGNRAKALEWLETALVCGIRAWSKLKPTPCWTPCATSTASRW